MSELSDDSMISRSIESVEAYINAFVDGPDVPLQRLAERSDPDAIRRKLAILLNAGRSHDAATLAKAHEMHVEWCDLAVRALVQAGESDVARRAVDWARAHASRVTALRCAFFFAQEGLVSIIRQRSDSRPIVAGDLTPAEQGRVSEVVAVLTPVLAAVGERIENELESQVVQAAFQAYDWLGNRQEVERLATVLESRRPVPLLLAHAALQKRISLPDGLAERLRAEHETSFEAKLLAILVEGSLQERVQDAYLAAKDLAFRTSSEEEQERVAAIIVGLAQNLVEPGARDEAEQLAESLLKNERFLKLLRADRLLRRGTLDRASEILEETRDETDPLWLQLNAKRMLQAGEGAAGAECLLKAGLVLPDPDILRTAASLAFEHGRIDLCLIALERLIAINANDARAYRHLATIHADTGNFARAAEQFQRLAELSLLEGSDRFNWSLCLAKAGDFSTCLGVLDGYSDPENIPLGACLLRAECLVALGDPASAFDSMKAHKSTSWDQPDFLREFVKLGFMSSNEAEGHEALLQLQYLQATNPAAEAVIQQLPLDTVVADLRERREQLIEMHRHMLHGECGWLLVDQTFGKAAYWGWRMRTQELGWVGDDPTNRAQFSLYSTNGFRVRTGSGSPPRLEEIEHPPKGTPAVVDLSALISLHRLGCLRSAAEYFGKLFVPSAYLENLINEARQLLPHQPSRVRAAKLIKEALDLGRISIASDKRAPVVSEYGKEDSDAYHIRDVLDVLHMLGKVSEAEYQSVLRAAHKPPRGELTPLRAGEALVMQLMTLQILTAFSQLAVLLQTFQVAITAADRVELDAELRAFKTQDEVWQWHNDLWKIVRSDAHFVQSVTTVPPDLKSQFDVVPVPLASALLAHETGACLLADDRIYQAVVLNERPNDASAAFGSDKVLLALYADHAITVDQLADGFLQLLSWRYRFIITPPDVLRTLANRFCQHPPGEGLRQIARYIHDCMRDPGLLGGKEPTDPPMSIAERLFMQWTASVAEFLVDVWSDPGWSEDRLRDLTEWAVKEMFPSAPPSTQLPGGRTIADIWMRLVLSRVLIRSCELEDAARANKAVRAVADALGVSEREYLLILSGAIDEP
jgi:tetratricopeptide (TPR) repeat protein